MVAEDKCYFWVRTPVVEAEPHHSVAVLFKESVVPFIVYLTSEQLGTDMESKFFLTVFG